VEAEYCAVVNAAAECIWLRQLLGELQCLVQKATLAFCGNISAMCMVFNPVHHRWMKHMLDIHFVCERVAMGEFRVQHVPSSQQFADIMMKGLPTTTFMEFRSSLNVG
jgi:hypothetical protein